MKRSIVLVVCLVISLGVDITNGIYAVNISFSSYCSQAVVTNWSCVYCTSQFTVVQYSYDQTTDTVGFVGYDDNNRRIVVAFRGSMTSLANIGEDLKSALISATFLQGIDSNALVHQGFYEVYRAHLQDITGAVSKLQAQYPDYGLWLTGHSLGGAVATIMASDFVFNQKISALNLITFGSPRVGNPAFAKAFDAVISHQRFVHWKDSFPHLPAEVYGYEQTSTEIFENEDGSHFIQCNGDEDANCSDQFDFFNADDHHTYLGISDQNCS